MGAGASAPTGVGSSPAPIVAPPVSTPMTTPTATPSSTPQGGKGGPTTAGTSPVTPAPVTPSVSPVAPTAPQQPQYNPFMQTYGQNNTPQQQMFNRFQPPQQQFRQPVTQPAQGPVYADQSLNAPGNQPQQFQQPQYGRFGRGFMPQNRGGYERQMDQLRGGYNRPMPLMMQSNPQAPQPDAAYNTYMQSLPEYAQRQDLQRQMEALSVKMQADPQGTTMRNALQANARQIMPQQDMGYGGDYGRFNMDRGQQQSPEEYARQRGYAYEPPARGNQTLDQFQLTQGRGQGATRYISPEEQAAMDAYRRKDAIDQANRPRFSDTPEQQAYANQMIAFKGQGIGQPAPNTQLSGALAAGLGQPNAPAGGKGGNPTATGSGVSDSRYA
jgi:hypothetical protein